jgi:site-specific DNA-methyltransferase (adenine-specific)
MSDTAFTNTLYYGDNLAVIRKYIRDESIDLIYLDPPFNSKADYNVLFKEASGEESTAQIQAFSDFWQWDIEARKAYEYLTIDAPNGELSNLTEALYKFLGKNNMLAYLVMMGERLLELHRVLKPTGSIYLHCDSTASHYLKLILDAVLGVENFRNEILWKRFNFHADAKRFGRVADRILFYTKSGNYNFNRQYAPYKKEYIRSKFVHKDEGGRIFRLSDLNPPGGRGPIYEFHGITRPWRVTKEKMLQLEAEGRIYTKSKVPQLKRYLDELEERGGAAVHEIWDDISVVNSQAEERMGFQTQKPVQLLERIIKASSNEGDIILDPFCGCGTSIIAAEKLHRHWIGIDITYLAINLIKNRINDTYPNVVFKVEGEPRDLGAAQELAKNRYQFQWWALSLIGARPVGATSLKPKEGRKGADEGVDGWLRFADVSEGHVEKIVVQVKSGHVGVKDIRELRDIVSRQNAAMGIFITLEEPTSEMIKEEKATDPYKSPIWNTEYPKIQIITIEQLLKGDKPKIPPISNMFKEAPEIKRQKNAVQKKLQ